MNPMNAALYAGFTNIVGAVISLLPYFLVSQIVTAMAEASTTANLEVVGISISAYLPQQVRQWSSQRDPPLS
jgi:VIT1/CCC1 family predicted Fe2+/Mn2+ transporter